MANKEWFVFQDEAQQGPYTLSELRSLCEEGRLSDSAFLFQIGWKNWREISGLADELRLKPADSGGEKRAQPPRASIRGRIFVHNKLELCLSEGVNISSTGIFVETRQHLFKPGEELILTCKIVGLGEPFHVQGLVMRYSENPRGYGIKFLKLKRELSQRIEDYLTAEVMDEAS